MKANAISNLMEKVESIEIINHSIIKIAQELPVMMTTRTRNIRKQKYIFGFYCGES